MGITYNFKCDVCGCEKYLIAENDYEKVLICEECAECYTVEQKQQRPAQPPNQVTCPFCNSNNIHKISGTERAASIIGLGIFSKKINKSFKCKKCGGTF